MPGIRVGTTRSESRTTETIARRYKEVHLDCGYRLDLLVANAVIVEIKAVESLAPIHQAQLLSYLRLSGCKVGLLINFNVKILKDGLRRLVNDFPA